MKRKCSLLNSSLLKNDEEKEKRGEGELCGSSR